MPRRDTERAFTASLRRFFGTGADVLLPIGDDAAVVRCGGEQLALKVDPTVAGVHFAPGTPWPLVGKKAINRALSDLAAVGAVPRWVLVSVLLPRGFAPRARVALFSGMRSAARAAGAVVVGGHTGSTRGPLVVDVAAAGTVPGRALSRSGAYAGDAVFVTGPLGGSRLGKHLRFLPRLREGVWLARQPNVGAAMDVSDGLALDLATLLARSGGLGAVLHAERIPVSAAARRLARGDRDDALSRALGDGEDFELLFTARGALARGGPLSARARLPIGVVTSRPGLWLSRRDGAVVPLAPKGYQHEL